MSITAVHITYTHDDGSTSEAELYADVGWQQWGNTKDRLSETGHITQAFAEYVYENDVLVNEEEGQ